MKPQDRIARLREFPVGDQDEFHVLMQEAEISWLLDVAEAALLLVDCDADPEYMGGKADLIATLRERLYGRRQDGPSRR